MCVIMALESLTCSPSTMATGTWRTRKGGGRVRNRPRAAGGRPGVRLAAAGRGPYLLVLRPVELLLAHRLHLHHAVGNVVVVQERPHLRRRGCGRAAARGRRVERRHEPCCRRGTPGTGRGRCPHSARPGCGVKWCGRARAAGTRARADTDRRVGGRRACGSDGARRAKGGGAPGRGGGQCEAQRRPPRFLAGGGPERLVGRRAAEGSSLTDDARPTRQRAVLPATGGRQRHGRGTERSAACAQRAAGIAEAA